MLPKNNAIRVEDQQQPRLTLHNRIFSISGFGDSTTASSLPPSGKVMAQFLLLPHCSKQIIGQDRTRLGNQGCIFERECRLDCHLASEAGWQAKLGVQEVERFSGYVPGLLMSGEPSELSRRAVDLRVDLSALDAPDRREAQTIDRSMAAIFLDLEVRA